MTQTTEPVDEEAVGPPRGRRCDAVLFDFFGTLVDYESRWSRIEYPMAHQLLAGWGHAIWHEVFVARLDLAFSGLERATAESCQEFSIVDAAEAFCQVSGIDLSLAQRELLAAAVTADWQQNVRPIPGVVEMIERLSERTRLGIVSNTHDARIVPRLLRAMGIADRFEATVFSIDHGYRKPHPSIYQAALDRMGLEAARVLFVGDSYEADLLGPKRVGMRALLIDPRARHGIAPGERLSSVLDVESRQATLGGGC